MIEASESGLFDGLEADAWFGASTARIGQLDQLEDQVLQNVAQLAEKAYADSIFALTMIVSIVLTTIGGVTVLSFFVVRGIAWPFVLAP